MRGTYVSAVLLSAVFLESCSHLEDLEDAPEVAGISDRDAGLSGRDAGPTPPPDAGQRDTGTGDASMAIVGDAGPQPIPDGGGDAGRPRYDLSVVNLVRDNQTGLLWQRNMAVPNPSCTGVSTHFSSFAGSACTWSEANNYCQSARWEGRTWRLPTVVELQSLVNHTKAPPNPLIDTTLFPSTPADRFWTSEGASPNAYSVCFCSGNSYYMSTSTYYHVRCVSTL